MDIGEIGELGLIEKIRQIVAKKSFPVVIGIGDDAAVIDTSADRQTLITTDVLVEEIHFKMDYFTYEQLGYRAMAANLSDIAAMAGNPEFAVVSIAITNTIAVSDIEKLYTGMKKLADRYNVVIIGGDTTRSKYGMFINIALIGSVQKGKYTTRSNAQIGDGIYITGNLGGSFAGMKLLSSKVKAALKYESQLKERHLAPNPRISEAQYLCEHILLNSMIDVSDGLASELNHICRCSNVGATIDENLIPLEPGIEELASQCGESAIDYALTGGEDFELVFTARMGNVEHIKKDFEQKFKLALTKVGQIVEAKYGITMSTSAGNRIPLDYKGWNHFDSNK